MLGTGGSDWNAYLLPSHKDTDPETQEAQTHRAKEAVGRRRQRRERGNHKPRSPKD